jgi:dimethylaniline monooxygenase (N-oxide forming)
MARFSDSPIKTPKLDDVYYGFFPARYVTNYLEDYVDSHVYAGESLRERIAFNTAVQSVRQSPSTRFWIVSTDSLSVFSTPKLLICAGLTSVPNMPSLPGQDSFKGKIMHHRDFGSSSVLKDPEVKHIAVLGGAKSAADIAYAAAKAGKRVSWIIRKSGSGPGGLLPAKGMGPYKNTNEVLYTRLTAALNPSMWARRNWAARLLHQSWIGRSIVDWIWGTSDASARHEAGFKERSKDDKTSYQNLQADTSIFWGDDSSGVNQRPDFWSTMALKNVQVFREDIFEIRKDQIVLPDATVSPHVIVCGTGWQPSYHRFLDEDLARNLGLPVILRIDEDQGPNLEDIKWSTLEQSADIEICRRFPRLQNPPRHHTSISTQSPFRLYKYMVPTNPDMRGIAFLGHIVIGNNFRAAECQSLWAVAYLDGQLSLPSKGDMEREVAMGVAWCRRRYLSKGALGNWLYFDLVPYTDALLEQLGLRSHRRKTGAKDFFSPCVAENLKDLLSEFRGKQNLASEHQNS